MDTCYTNGRETVYLDLYYMSRCPILSFKTCDILLFEFELLISLTEITIINFYKVKC